MKLIAKLSLLLIACTSLSVASVDLHFKRAFNNNKACVYEANTNKCLMDNGIERVDEFQADHELRMRFIDPPKSSSGKFGFYLDRPFFIIDGIHLSTTESRTLDAFQEEADAFGMTQMLKSLGYTPILVQFTETVRRSLQWNSTYFSQALQFLNNNTCIPFPNKRKDGFVVMGISQGGIIGRYGSYLYSSEKQDEDTPIKFFASLDSPHQGAVMPRGLLTTLDFWANKAGEASATAFYDLVNGAGAHDLLLYETKKGDHSLNIANDRFLFNDYRKAAEYKGFPAVLIAQGQLKGNDPSHNSKYFELNRKGSILGVVVGRAKSYINSSTQSKGTISENREYKISDFDYEEKKQGESELDFVQGSTYPFAKTLYESLREGILNALPADMKQSTGIFSTKISIDTKWDADNLYQENSTFIPTVSAMDLYCDGKLAIMSDCAHTQKATGISFDHPGNFSTGIAAYAVDPTHPRYNEPISGRHIESPIRKNQIDTTVLYGMQVDIWRILCSLAKFDYDPKTKTFDNPALNGYFSPTTQCTDISKMPTIVKNSGKNQQKRFGYVRYDFNPDATESTSSTSFTLPAGWQKVSILDNGEQIPAGTIFEVDISVKKSKGNWMKAELLLTTNKQGSHQLQLTEQNVAIDENVHTIKWIVPASMEAVRNYRWFRLILNSEGGEVTISNPRLITSATSFENTPKDIPNASIYPNANISIVPWSSNVSIQETGIGNSAHLQAQISSKNDGLHFDFGSEFSLEKFKEIKIAFKPGTCQNTMIYFDSKNPNGRNLVKYTLQNDIAYKILPLSKIIDTVVTPNHTLSASRLVLQAIDNNENCSIQSISLQ